MTRSRCLVAILSWYECGNSQYPILAFRLQTAGTPGLRGRSTRKESSTVKRTGAQLETKRVKLSLTSGSHLHHRQLSGGPVYRLNPYNPLSFTVLPHTISRPEGRSRAICGAHTHKRDRKSPQSAGQGTTRAYTPTKQPPTSGYIRGGQSVSQSVKQPPAGTPPWLGCPPRPGTFGRPFW